MVFALSGGDLPNVRLHASVCYCQAVTVVAAYVTKTGAAIGADTGLFEDGGLYQHTAIPKVWRVGKTLQGGAGSGAVLTAAAKLAIEDPYALAAGLAQMNIQGEWSLLVVTRRAIFELCEDGSVFQFRESYSAIGAANSVALGSLATLVASKSPLEADRAVRLALEVSVRHHTLCVAPLQVLKI